MKKTIITSLLLVSTLVVSAAKPILIGRRGSGYGVENTAQAFIAGADMGFKYMECHVRLTADSVFVAAHDGKTARLGGRLKVESSPLDSLRSELYTQVVNGHTYTGRIATVGEVLDICRERGVHPVLHLKKIKGINDKDCSMMPALVELIRSKGLESSCIILTSMQGVIDYMQANYPDIKLQFQADDKWQKLFDWTVARHVDVDIKVECIDPTTIGLYHDRGLTVTTWTVNSYPEYYRLAAEGIDFIITDTLSPRVVD